MSSEESRQSTATFRFQVIAPLVVRELGARERAHILRDLANRLWKTPDGRTIRVHGRTIARWVARYRAQGYAGLLPEVRVDRGAHRRLPEQVLARAIALRQEDPSRSVRTIIRILELEGLAQPGQVKRTTLSHALCRAGVSRAEVTRAKETFKLREAPYPNALWQIDTQHALYLPGSDGRRRTLYLVACLDDYSRHVVARFYPADDRPCLADLLKRAIIARGKPEILYADNGANYRSNLLANACAQLGIELRHSRPYRPAGRGKIERWFRTADTRFNREAQALIDHGRITTLEQVQEFFAAWLHSEYNARVHSSTHEAPNDRLARVHPDHPTVWVDPQALAHAFLWTQTRVVSAVATISVEGNDYQVDPALARRKVTIRFDPYDLRTIHVAWDGRDYGRATPLELAREYSRHVRPPAAGQSEAAEQVPAERTPFLDMVLAQDELRRFAEAGRTRFATPDSPANGGEG
ncbi:MAG: DDE-type integrase/transposase/recombinase [Acetobacteraceae bacterium]|nr:DDE-type integrase/transposase/recombinase [Acetobacteraceae bacterium]